MSLSHSDQIANALCGVCDLKQNFLLNEKIVKYSLFGNLNNPCCSLINLLFKLISIVFMESNDVDVGVLRYHKGVSINFVDMSLIN